MENYLIVSIKDKEFNSGTELFYRINLNKISVNNKNLTEYQQRLSFFYEVLLGQIIEEFPATHKGWYNTDLIEKLKDKGFNIIENKGCLYSYIDVSDEEL